MLPRATENAVAVHMARGPPFAHFYSIVQVFPNPEYMYP